MATRIRLARGGAKKSPYYRIVVCDSRSPRDGSFIEKVGSYNPLLNKDNPARVTFKEERIKHWLGVGATPSERVEKFLTAVGIMKLSKKHKALLDARIAKQKAKDAEKAKAKQAEEAQKAKEEAEAKTAENTEENKTNQAEIAQQAETQTVKEQEQENAASTNGTPETK